MKRLQAEQNQRLHPDFQAVAHGGFWRLGTQVLPDSDPKPDDDVILIVFSRVSPHHLGIQQKC